MLEEQLAAAAALAAGKAGAELFYWSPSSMIKRSARTRNDEARLTALSLARPRAPVLPLYALLPHAHAVGERIDNKESVLYWAAKNDIPVFCPAITDGSVGDMIYFHSFKRPGLVVDIAQDIRKLNNLALKAKRSGMLIFGGGLVKHHICNGEPLLRVIAIAAAIEC